MADTENRKQQLTLTIARADEQIAYTKRTGDIHREAAKASDQMVERLELEKSQAQTTLGELMNAEEEPSE